MAWLALGSTLLLLALMGAGGKPRLDAPTAASGICLLATGLTALRVYQPGMVAAILFGGLCAALLLGRAGMLKRRPARWAALTVGAVASLFALFGPADGLF